MICIVCEWQSACAQALCVNAFSMQIGTSQQYKRWNGTHHEYSSNTKNSTKKESDVYMQHGFSLSVFRIYFIGKLKWNIFPRTLVRSFGLFGWLWLIDDMKTRMFFVVLCVDCVWVWKAIQSVPVACSTSKCVPIPNMTRLSWQLKCVYSYCVQSNVLNVYAAHTLLFLIDMMYVYRVCLCVCVSIQFNGLLLSNFAPETFFLLHRPSSHFYSINAFNQQIWQNNFRCVALLENKNKINFVCFEWSMRNGGMLGGWGSICANTTHLRSNYIPDIELTKFSLASCYVLITFFMSSGKSDFK